MWVPCRITSARVEAAEIKLQQAREVYQRDKQLHEQKILAREQYEQSFAAFRSAEVDLNAARETLEPGNQRLNARTAHTNNTLVRATREQYHTRATS